MKQKKKIKVLSIVASAALLIGATLSMTACGDANNYTDDTQTVSEVVNISSDDQNVSTITGVVSHGEPEETSNQSDATHETSTEPLTVEEAKNKLVQGNATYLSPDKDKDLREDLTTNGQHPYAIVVTCADSRVSPEVMFNAGMGEIFVIRTAGNVVDDFEIGSVEYAAEHLGSPLVVVMGHTNCGAVTAAVEGGEVPGDIKSIVEEITPSVDTARKLAKDDASILSKATELNVQNSIAKINDSEVMQHLEHEGKVSVVGAVYDIQTGQVNYLS